MKSDKQKTTIINSISSKHYIVILFIFIFGILFVFLSKLWDDHNLLHHIFRDTGIALLPLSIIGFAYEIALRKQFLNEMKNEMKRNVDEAIDKSIPSSLKHLRDTGVVDAYERLDRQSLLTHIKNCDVRTEIRILDIWFENLHFLKKELLNAIIEKGCRVTILLWDIEEQDVLARRAHSLRIVNDGVRTLMIHIHENLKTITSMFEKLENSGDTDLKNLLQVKIYSSFIGISLFGIGSDYYLGFYLRETYSSDGTQLKISGYDRFFYHQITNHFDEQWNDTTNKTFGQYDLPYYTEVLEKYIMGEKQQKTSKEV